MPILQSTVIELTNHAQTLLTAQRDLEKQIRWLIQMELDASERRIDPARNLDDSNPEKLRIAISEVSTLSSILREISRTLEVQRLRTMDIETRVTYWTEYTKVRIKSAHRSKRWRESKRQEFEQPAKPSGRSPISGYEDFSEADERFDLYYHLVSNHQIPEGGPDSPIPDLATLRQKYIAFHAKNPDSENSRKEFPAQSEKSPEEFPAPEVIDIEL